MKKLLCLYLCFIAHHFIFGQEQITNFISQNSNVKYILREVEKEQYIITVDKLDSLKVYKLDGTNTAILHSRYYANIYNDYSIDNTDRFILIENVKGSVAYNFVTDEEYWIYYAGNHTYTRWYIPYEGFVFLTQSTKDFTNGIHYLVDLKNMTKEILSEDSYFWGLGMTDNFLYLRSYDSILQNEIHLLKNRVNQVIDTMAIGIFNSNTNFGDSTFVYQSNLELLEYHNYSKSTRKIGRLSSPYDVKIIDAGNTYICSNTTSGKTYVSIINKKTLDMEVDSLDDDYDRPHSEVLQNKLIYGDFSYVVIYDLTNRQTYKFHSNAKDPKNYAFLDNKYLIHKFFYSLMMIDLQSLAHDTLLANMDYVATFQKIESIKIGDKHVVNYESISERPYSLIEIDVHLKKASVSNLMSKNNSGLIQGSKIEKLGKSVVLLSESDVYHIVDDRAIRLNKSPILKVVHHTYKVDSDRLMWLEQNGNTISAYTFENETKILHTTFSTHIEQPPYNLNIYDYLVTPGKTFIRTFGFEKQFLEILHATGEINIIGETGNSFSFENMKQTHGHFYYFTSEGLTVDLASGENKIIDLDFPEQGFLNLYKFKDEVYTFAIDGFYRLIGDKSERLLEVVENGFDFNYFIDYGDYGIIYANDMEYFFDGQNIISITINLQYGTLLSKDILALATTTGTNTTFTTFYNIKTQSYIALPQDIAKMLSSVIFTNFNTDYLVAKSGFHPYYNIHIFRINEDYTTFTEIVKFESSGWDAKIDFKAYGNEGLLYIGSKIYLMNDTIGFEYMSKIAGDEDAVGSVEDKGYFYFLGIHPTAGRQLFRTLAMSLRSDTEEEKKSTDNTLAPNPCIDEINIIGTLEKLSAYNIYNEEGKMVQQGTIDHNKILVNALHQGKYIFSIIDKKGVAIKSFVFVKI